MRLVFGPPYITWLYPFLVERVVSPQRLKKLIFFNGIQPLLPASTPFSFYNFLLSLLIFFLCPNIPLSHTHEGLLDNYVAIIIATFI